jgi:hypothetical protein
MRDSPAPSPRRPSNRPAAATLLAGTLPAAALLMLLFSLAGCAADHRPQYVAPPLSDGEVATITGVKTLFAHYYIGEVDGAKVQDQGAMFYSAGGSVKVLPGERHLGIFSNNGGGQQSWSLTHEFVAGHRYLLGPSDKLGGMMGGGLVIKDSTTGEVTRVH